MIRSKPSEWAVTGLLVSALTGACACAGATPPASAPHRHWVPGYAFGLWGKAELDVRDDCPEGGAESVRIGVTLSTLLVSLVTIGIYTPREVRVQCWRQ